MPLPRSGAEHVLLQEQPAPTGRCCCCWGMLPEEGRQANTSHTGPQARNPGGIEPGRVVMRPHLRVPAAAGTMTKRLLLRVREQELPGSGAEAPAAPPGGSARPGHRHWLLSTGGAPAGKGEAVPGPDRKSVV